jgi:methionyl-tRNA formyltransferase
MRILACLNRDLASSMALNHLLPALGAHEVLVALSERVGAPQAKEAEPAARVELRCAEQHLPNDAFFPLVERAGLPDRGSRFLAFGELERLRNIPVVSLPNANVPAGLETIRRFAPDLIVTIRYGSILKSAAIAIPRHGVLNLHSGLLPAYRGVLATFRALMNGDAEIGCTLHYIHDGTIDTGDIVDTHTIPVRCERSLLWHVLALYPGGIGLLMAAIEEIASGRSPRRTRQATDGGAYYTYPTPDEWAEFARRGWRIADPSDLAEAFTHYTR